MATTPLENSEVLRMVLEQIPCSRQILRLSLVNKQWNYEALSVLKGRNCSTLIIDSHDPRKSLADLASDLQQIQVVPWIGMTFVLYYDRNTQSSFKESLDPSFNVLVDRLPLKYLVVHFLDDLGDFADCNGLVLVQKLLELFHGVLEELTLHLNWELDDKMYEQLFQSWSFPCLRTVNIEGDSTDKPLSSFLKALVSRTPNLREITIEGGAHFQQNILEGSSAVLQPLMEFDPLHERVCESLLGSVRAETIAILADTYYTPFDVELLNTVVPTALRASRTSLKTLRMDLLIAVPLMCYGICLENVTKLEIWRQRHLVERISSHELLKGFDFPQIFPKLEHIEIVNRCRVAITVDKIGAFLPRWSQLIKENLPVNIKRLTLNESPWESMLPFWAHKFPHVQTLSVDTGAGELSQFPFPLLWEHFVSLKELLVTTVHRGLAITVNLDSVFCGIFPEEVAELVQKDEEYLRAVNIVPVMPAFTCLRGLRTFKLDFTVPSISSGRLETGPGPAFLFSKVTALSAFARCPSLAVTFETKSYSAEALSHMRPYVTFIIK